MPSMQTPWPDTHLESVAVAGAAGQPEPQHVHRRAEGPQRQGEPFPDHRGPTVGGDRQIRTHLDLTTRAHRPDTGHDAAVPDDVGDLVRAQQGEGRNPPGGLGQQVQQMPLRHEADVGVRDPEAGEIGEGERAVGEGDGEPFDVAMRQFQQLLPEPEFVEQVQGRGMHGVAAEVAQEVGVLLQQHHPDTLPGQQQGRHQARRSTPGDADVGR